MTPSYICFHNADADRTSAVWLYGPATPVQLWTYLKKQDSEVFHRPISAGMAHFETKTKKFKAYSSCPSLNLVPHEEDSRVLEAALMDNKTLSLYVHDLGAPEFSLILGSSEVLQSSQFEEGVVQGRGAASFMVHDSQRPFRIEVPTIKGLGPMTYEYLRYIETRLFV